MSLLTILSPKKVELLLTWLIQAHLNIGEFRFSLDLMINISVYNICSHHLQRYKLSRKPGTEE